MDLSSPEPDRGLPRSVRPFIALALCLTTAVAACGSAQAPLDQLVRGLVEVMVEAHASDPALYQLLLTELPQDGNHQGEARLRNALKDALSSRESEIERSLDLDRLLFVVTHMLESLVHGVVLRRPPSLSLADATQEAVRALLGYIHAAA
jgi:Tetracyclin repressor-like, C-terminal domain